METPAQLEARARWIGLGEPRQEVLLGRRHREAVAIAGPGRGDRRPPGHRKQRADAGTSEEKLAAIHC
jgi:hypothetical protein